MKLYNKKGLLLGIFWLAVGLGGLILEIARPSSVKAVFIRDIVLFSLLLLFSLRQIVRAFSARASREDFLEERDERNRYIRLKTGCTMFKVAEALLLIWVIGSAATFGLTRDEIWTMAVIVSGLTLGLLFIIELIVGIHYEGKE